MNPEYTNNYQLGFKNGYLDAKYLNHTSEIALNSSLPYYAMGYFDGQCKSDSIKFIS